MHEQMDCQKYRDHLDEWLDGELSDEMAAAMQSHEQTCPECAEAARLARETLNFIHSLEDDIPVPLETQAAWRNAVREEVRSRKVRRFPAAMRAIGSVAAAFILLVGCTAFFRSNGMLDIAAPQPAMIAETADTSAEPAIAAARIGESVAAGQRSADYAVPMAFVASDGGIVTEGVTPGSSGSDEIIPLQTEAPMLIRSMERTIVTDNFDGAGQNIRDLTEQYGGYLASDATSTAENGLRTGEFTAMIPAVEADSFLQTIDHVGNVTYSAEHLDDASTSVQDVQSRIDALNAEKDRLNELITEAADADTLAELRLQLQGALTEIDTLQSEANRLELELQNVRISIRLEELYPAATASPTAEPGLGGRMSAAFNQSADNLRSFVRDMAVSLMIIAPFLLIALGVVAVVIAVVVLIRRHRKNGK